MPSCTRPCVGRASRSCSSKRMAPLAARSRPMMVFISVVLPAPLRPMRPVMLPVGSSSDTPRRICTAAIDTLRFCTLSTPAHHVPLHLRVREGDFRRRVGDDAPVVEGDHALREAADHLHVVLDEEHGSPLGAYRLEHHLHDAELLLR